MRKRLENAFSLEAGGPPPYWLIVLDDVHHVVEEARDLLGALLDISTKSPLAIVIHFKDDLDVYDRRDVHTRDVVQELALKGLSLMR